MPIVNLADCKRLQAERRARQCFAEAVNLAGYGAYAEAYRVACMGIGACNRIGANRAARGLIFTLANKLRPLALAQQAAADAAMWRRLG